MASENANSHDFELINHYEANLEPDELEKIQKWLQPTNYAADSSEFRRHLASQAPGTGHWVCGTLEFEQWQTSENHGSLWITGAPGAGKSVLAASMVHHLKVDDEILVLHFFFRHNASANRDSQSLVRDWLAQLLPYSLRLQATLQPLSSRDLEGVSNEQLWEHLLEALLLVKKAYCVVDALDEMELDDKFLQRLNSLARFRPGSVKLFMTSQPKEYLQNRLGDTSIMHIKLESDMVRKDIAVFVSHHLQTSLPGPDHMELRSSFALEISTKSCGLFLYARLLLDQIVPTLASGQQMSMQNLATTLPVGFEEMYTSMLLKQSQLLELPGHPGIGTKIQIFLLECVTHSSRPLRLNELADALNVVFIPSIAGLPLASFPQWDPEQVTRIACAPLLEILEDGTIQVIHHSFTEFLLDHDLLMSRPGVAFSMLDSSEIHKKLAETCIRYLQSGCLVPKDAGANFIRVCDDLCDHGDWRSPRALLEDPFEYQQLRLQHPFIEYAVRNWTWHASHYYMEDTGFFDLVSQFMDGTDIAFKKWLILEWQARHPVTEVEIPSRLHVAADAGMTKYASHLIQRGQGVELLDLKNRTPLHLAAEKGHAEIASLFLQHGANPNRTDFEGFNPLHRAAKNNHAGTVQLLLGAGVDPLTPSIPKKRAGNWRRTLRKQIKGKTAVAYVCSLGHTESILEILPFVEPQTLEEILCSCCRYGKYEAARAVLENSNISPNATFEGFTALYLATTHASAKCVDLLLAWGADPNLPSQWQPMIVHRQQRVKENVVNETPLHLIATAWRSPRAEYRWIFDSLVRSGADLEARTTYGITPLLLLLRGYMASDHYLPAIKSFLEAGSDISAVGNTGRFPRKPTERSILQQLLEGDQNLKLFDLLLEHGADIHVLDKEGRNTLHLALQNRATEPQEPKVLDTLVTKLLAGGVQADTQDDTGCTPLRSAVQNSHCSLKTVKTLIQACSNPRARESCIPFIGNRSQVEIGLLLQMFLSAGVSLEGRDETGATPLLMSLPSPHVFQHLLGHGAEIDAEDNRGRGILHYYVHHPCASIERMEMLVGLGLDPKKVDREGNTLLHVGIHNYDGTPKSAQFIEKLLGWGIPLDAKNDAGSTAAHIHIKESSISSSTNERRPVPRLELFQWKPELDINAQDNEGLTILHLAALRSEIQVFQVLAAGADISILTKQRRSALYLASRAQKPDTVCLLSSKMGQEVIDQQDSSGRTALHEACAVGQFESVYCLLKSGASIKCEDSKGRTPLHACAEYPLERSLSLLRQQSGDICGSGLSSKGTGQYQSSYHSLSLPNQDCSKIRAIVKELLIAGADINKTDKDGKTPLDLALLFDCREMILALQSSHPDIRCYQLEAAGPELEIELALRKLPRTLCEPLRNISLVYPPPDIDFILTYHETAKESPSDKVEPFYDEGPLLHAAAKYGLIDVIERLKHRVMFYDSSPNLQPPENDDDLAQRRPSRLHKPGKEDVLPILHTACKARYPNLKMLELLIDMCHVDINARSRERQHRDSPHSWHGYDNLESTALHWLALANSFWQLDGIRYLVEKGADINATNEKGQTPLYIASTWSPGNESVSHEGFWRPQCVDLLLSLGADPNIVDKKGLAPLHEAVSSTKITMSLLRARASFSTRETSPIFNAIRAQNLDVLISILDAGGDVNAVMHSSSFGRSNRGQARTALLCATLSQCYNRYMSDSVPLIKLLIDRGADMYAPLNETETLIHYVFEHGMRDAVNVYLERHDQIDVETRDQIGRTILLAACNWDVWYQDNMDTRLHPVHRLLAHGADITATSNDGRTVLHHLLDNSSMGKSTILQVLEQQPEICKKMLTHKDNGGYSPFHLALRTLRPSICSRLLDLGADILDPDPTGATALHHIASQYLQFYRASQLPYCFEMYTSGDHEKILELWSRYIDLGGSINVRDGTGSPPLFAYLSSAYSSSLLNTMSIDRAQQCCHLKSLPNLFGADDLDMAAKNNAGDTALHIIARRDPNYNDKGVHNIQLFKFFIKDVDILAESKDGMTALDLAAVTRKAELLELFQRG